MKQIIVQTMKKKLFELRHFLEENTVMEKAMTLCIARYAVWMGGSVCFEGIPSIFAYQKKEKLMVITITLFKQTSCHINIFQLIYKIGNFWLVRFFSP